MWKAEGEWVSVPSFYPTEMNLAIFEKYFLVAVVDVVDVVLVVDYLIWNSSDIQFWLVFLVFNTYK